MSNDLNQWNGIGRLTRDPEFKQTQTGTSICKFGIAVGRKYKDQEEVSFFNVTAFGRLGEIVNQYARKGKQVAVSGRLKQDRWQTTEGTNRDAVHIIAENVQLLGGGKGKENDESNIPF